jgi:hypothetical protein
VPAASLSRTGCSDRQLSGSPMRSMTLGFAVLSSGGLVGRPARVRERCASIRRLARGRVCVQRIPTVPPNSGLQQTPTSLSLGRRS